MAARAVQPPQREQPVRNENSQSPMRAASPQLRVHPQGEQACSSHTCQRRAGGHRLLLPSILRRAAADCGGCLQRLGPQHLRRWLRCGRLRRRARLRRQRRRLLQGGGTKSAAAKAAQIQTVPLVAVAGGACRAEGRQQEQSKQVSLISCSTFSSSYSRFSPSRAPEIIRPCKSNRCSAKELPRHEPHARVVLQLLLPPQFS